MSNSAVVPFNMEQGNLILAQMGLTEKDHQTLQKGMKYLAGPEVDAWVGRRKSDFQKIFTAAQKSIAITDQLQSVQTQITAAHGELRSIGEQRTEVDENESKENDQFKSESNDLSARLEDAKELVRNENRFAVCACTHPLATKMGRWFVSAGRYALSIAAPVLGIAHRTALTENCGQAISRSLASPQCISTVAQSSFYIPLAIATGTTLLCNYAFKVGQRILRNQAKADQLQGQLEARQLSHDTQLAQFKQTKQELSESQQKTMELVEQGQKDQESLQHQQQAIQTDMAGVREKIMSDVVHREIEQTEEALQHADTPFGQNVIRRSMQTFFDAVLTTFSEKQQSLAAIASSSAVPQIKEE